MQRPNVHYGKKVLRLGLARGIVDELIGRLVADVGDARAAAETAVVELPGAEPVTRAREKIGEDEVDDIVGANPGLA